MVSAGSATKVEVGPFCSIAGFTVIISDNHPIQQAATFKTANGPYASIFNATQTKKGDIKIGADVWIGSKATILTGVSIGNGAIIGSNSVVSRNAPAFSVAVGTPARVVNHRFEDHISSWLQELRWWNWEQSKLNKNRWVFQEKISGLNRSQLFEIQEKIEE
jgi:virginiamycin A acetyltransferase